MYIDGASPADGEGIGIIITGPSKITFQNDVKLDFPMTNNAAEYEALIKGLELIREISPDRVVIKSDSKLVTGHVNKSFQVKDDSIGKYLAKDKKLLSEMESKGIIWQVEKFLETRTGKLIT